MQTTSFTSGKWRSLAGNLWIEGLTATVLGRIAFLRGDFETAKEMGKIGLDHSNQTGQLVGKSLSLSILGWVACIEGDYHQARQLCEQALLHVPRSSHNFNVDWPLSLVASVQGDLTTAIQANRDTLSHSYQRRALAETVYLLPASIFIATHQGNPKRAVELLSLAFNHPKSATGWLEKWPLIGQLRRDLEDELGSEAYNAAWEQGKALDLMTVVEELLAEYEENQE